MTRSLALLTLGLLSACGPILSGNSADSAGDGGAESGAGQDGGTTEDTATAGDDGGAESAGTGGNPALDACLEACRMRDELVENEGFCQVEWSADAPCEEVCERLADEPDVGGIEAVTVCIERDPLCFQTLEQCVCMQFAPADECAP
jgi:hypothetical protein